MRKYHSAELIALPLRPINYLIDGILPLGTGGDVSGPPGEGKSTILLSMSAAISTGSPWFGNKAQRTPCAWVSGEASGGDAIGRDLHRLKVGRESDVTFFLPDAELFRWMDGLWVTTTEGRAVIDSLRACGCGFVVLDTIGSLCAGIKEVDNDQQRQLARHLRHELAGLTWLTISHTNQASAKDSIAWRLHYLSRAGGNGFPGAVRWAAGVSAIIDNDYAPTRCALPPWDNGKKRYVGFGVSKHNEMPAPGWTNRRPTIFEMQPDGGLVLIIDGRELVDATPKNESGRVRHAVCPF